MASAKPTGPQGSGSKIDNRRKLFRGASGKPVTITCPDCKQSWVDGEDSTCECMVFEKRNDWLPTQCRTCGINMGDPGDYCSIKCHENDPDPIDGHIVYVGDVMQELMERTAARWQADKWKNGAYDIMDDWKNEERKTWAELTLAEKAKVLQWIEQEKCQWFSNDAGGWADQAPLSVIESGNVFRPKPSEKATPLDRETAMLVTLWRRTEGFFWQKATGFGVTAVKWGGMFFDYSDLATNGAECSFDDGKTWGPCTMEWYRERWQNK